MSSIKMKKEIAPFLVIDNKVSFITSWILWLMLVLFA